jgi:hypothetical protein
VALMCRVLLILVNIAADVYIPCGTYRRRTYLSDVPACTAVLVPSPPGWMAKVDGKIDMPVILTNTARAQHETNKHGRHLLCACAIIEVHN